MSTRSQLATIIIYLSRVDAPDDAEGQMLMSFCPSAEENTPVFSPPRRTSRWITNYLAGDESGCYEITLQLFGGNTTQAFVGVPTLDECLNDDDDDSDD